MISFQFSVFRNDVTGRVGRGSPGSLLLGLCWILHVATHWSGGAETVPAGPSSSPPAAQSGAQPSDPAAEPVPIEQRPYRVRIAASFAEDSSLLPKQRTGLLAELQECADRCVGEMWQLQVSEEHRLAIGGLDGLNRVSVADLKMHFPAQKIDKLFLLSVEPAGAGYRLAGREWDTTTDQWSAVREDLVFRQPDIVRGWLSLIRELFRPLTVVDQSRSGTVAVRAQAGELAPTDTDWVPLRKGQVLEPYHRFAIGKQAPGGIQPVPWTYLIVDRVERGRGACQLLTGLRAPLSARRRVETFALGIRREAPATRLSLVAQRPPSKPLVGIEVEVVTEQKQKALRLVSDRTGAVDIPAGTSGQPLWLYIRNGQAQLARLPYVPGSRSAESVELPDDSLRLSVEGDLSMMQAALVDAVARRAVLTATARSQAKAGDWKQTDAALKQLAELPNAAFFTASLNAIRLPAVQAAREQKQPDAAARINKLCDETGELISRYLGDVKLRDVMDEIAELRKATTEDRDAEAEAKTSKKKAEASKPAKKAQQPKVDAAPKRSEP